MWFRADDRITPLDPTHNRAVWGRCSVEIRLKAVRFSRKGTCKFELFEENIGQDSHEAAVEFDRNGQGQKWTKISRFSARTEKNRNGM